MDQYPYGYERLAHYQGAGRPGAEGGQHVVPPQASHAIAQHQLAIQSQLAELGPHAKRMRMGHDVTQPLRIDTDTRPQKVFEYIQTKVLV